MFKNPDDFLILNGVVVTLLVVYFLFIKKGSTAPTRLNLKKKRESQAGGLVVPGEVSGSGSTDYVPLNVIFNYNGHSFDAYEALGVPAGSDLAEVKKAYADICAGANASSKEFYKAAFDAISTSR